MGNACKIPPNANNREPVLVVVEAGKPAPENYFQKKPGVVEAFRI